MANLFMPLRPLLGWRQVVPTERRTAKELAEVLRYLAAELYPDAERRVLVTDSPNAHSPACLYEAFAPDGPGGSPGGWGGSTPPSTGAG